MATAAVTSRRGTKPFHASLLCAAPSGVYDDYIVIDADIETERKSCTRCWNDEGYTAWLITDLEEVS